jgi:hypothetical protein
VSFDAIPDLHGTLASLLDEGTTYTGSRPYVNRFQKAADDFSPFLEFSIPAQERLASPTAWLNDECVNSVTALIQQQLLKSSNQYNANDCAIFHSGVFRFVEQNSPDEKLWKVARRSRYWKRRFWLIPIHHDRTHWCVALVKVKKGVVYLYDSYGRDYETFEGDVLQVITSPEYKLADNLFRLFIVSSEGLIISPASKALRHISLLIL